MNERQIEPMVNLVIENLHLLGYIVISITEKNVTLDHLGKVLTLPIDDFMPLFYAHIGAIKYMIDKRFN